MAHRRQFARGAQAIRQRRETSWLEVEPVSSTIGGTTAVITHVMSAAELAKRPFTIIRTHLVIRVISDQFAASEAQIVGVGACVVSDQAVAIGVTAVPTPMVDIESELWFLHQMVFNEFTFGSGVGFDSNAGTMVNIDSKAMRKVNDGEQAIFVVETDNLSAGAIIVVGGRVLIKEH